MSIAAVVKIDNQYKGDTYDGVQFTVRLSNDVQQFKTSVTDQYTFELDFIEAL